MDRQFEERFLELCQLLGSTPDVIRKAIGTPDDETVNESGTRFLFYSPQEALFVVDSDTGIAKYVESPMGNVHGSRPRSPTSLAAMAGVRVGDARSRVRELWGPPSSQAIYVWLYTNRRGTTSAGSFYELAVSFFRSDAGENGPVCGFEGRLVEETHKPHTNRAISEDWLASGPEEARDRGSTDALNGSRPNPPGNWSEDYKRGYVSMQGVIREDLLRKNHGGCVVILLFFGAAVLTALHVGKVL